MGIRTATSFDMQFLKMEKCLIIFCKSTLINFIKYCWTSKFCTDVVQTISEMTQAPFLCGL